MRDNNTNIEDLFSKVDEDGDKESLTFHEFSTIIRLFK